MKQNITFKIEEILIYGNLDLEKKLIILDLNIDKSIKKKLIDNFHKGLIFNIFGEFNNNLEKFTAFDCSVIEYKLNGVIKIHILDLYVGNIYIKNIKNQKINKATFQFTYLDNFQNISNFIINEKFKITMLNDKKTFQISVDNDINLDEMNKVLFELKTFFQIIILNKNIEFSKKTFFIKENEKIVKVIKNNDLDYSLNLNRLIEFPDITNERILEWFEKKNKFGKIFDYLSGILNENSFTYLEFKYISLIQWIEAYSGVLFDKEFTKKKIEKDIDLKIKKFKEIIDSVNSSFLTDNEKKDFKENFSFDKQGYTFSEKLERLFSKNKTLETIFNSNQDLLYDIKNYRNKLIHLNIKDNLENKQIHNLYEILKNIIYILIIEELDLKDNRFYNEFQENAKKYFELYKELKIQKVKI